VKATWDLSRQPNGRAEKYTNKEGKKNNSRPKMLRKNRTGYFCARVYPAGVFHGERLRRESNGMVQVDRGILNL